MLPCTDAERTVGSDPALPPIALHHADRHFRLSTTLFQMTRLARMPDFFRSIRPVFLIPIDRSIPGVAARSSMEQISIYDHEKNGSQLSIGR